MTLHIRALATTSAVVVITFFAYVSSAAADDMATFATGGYARGLRTMEMMHKLDANHDGMVSAEEWEMFQARTFDLMDRDKSGFLDEKEFTTPPEGALAFATAAYVQGLMNHEMFRKIDANRDGKISKEEFLSYQRKIFAMMDKGKKGMVGPTDFILKGGT